MSIGHGYVTFVQDQEAGRAAAVGTLSLSALADQDLAQLLADGYRADFAGGLRNLDGEPEAADLMVSAVDFTPQALLTDEFKLLLGSALGASDLDDAMTRWETRIEPEASIASLVDDVLGAMVLAEHSNAAAEAAAGVVGAAAATAESHVLVALVTASHIGGVAVLIASPLGIVVVGAGAAYVTFRLLTHRRKRR